jgi:predicted ester cyclase
LGRHREKPKIMTTKPAYYRIYLLTVWQERNRGPPEQLTWRFRLEDPRTGQQQAFADAATFITALQRLTVSGQGAEENMMSTTESRAFIQQYLAALSGKAKPPTLVNHYVADADEALRQHIADAEAAFPYYELIAEDLIAEGDKAVVRFTLRAIHQGEFMGIPATGRTINVPGMIIYRIATDKNNAVKIVAHWMQIDSVVMMQQLGVQA